MISETDICCEHENNRRRIDYYTAKSYLLYEELRTFLKSSRKRGVPFIGNPVLKLENQVIMLFYSFMQHQMNCELYSGLLLESQISQDLRMQLMSLYKITSVLFERYDQYSKDWELLKMQEEDRIVKIKKLSISA